MLNCHAHKRRIRREAERVRLQMIELLVQNFLRVFTLVSTIMIEKCRARTQDSYYQTADGGEQQPFLSHPAISLCLNYGNYLQHSRTGSLFYLFLNGD